MNFTNETIKSLEVTEKRKVFWDPNNSGFGVRVAPTGLKTFVFMYRFHGKSQMLTIGRFPEERLDAMLNQVKTLKEALKGGEDPKAVISSESINGLTLDKTGPTKKILSEKEIATFWNGIEKIDLSIHVKVALKLMLFFGQTKKNILQTQWSHLDFETNRWTIPKLAKKEVYINALPLLDKGNILFGELPKISQWVFPSPKRSSHISEASIDQAIRYIRFSSDIPILTASNLRRTVGVNMANSGIHCSVVKEILGFKTNDNFPFIEVHQFPGYSLNTASEASESAHNYNLKISAFHWWHNYLTNILSIKTRQNQNSKKNRMRSKKSWILKILN